MCIFVALLQENGYILGSNRDDQATRKTDTNVTYDDTRHCQYVKDLQSGGTWLAVHDNGLYAVLLNHSPSVKGKIFPSRGELPLRVMDIVEGDGFAGDIENILQKITIRTYNSCVLAVGYMNDGVFCHNVVTWDAVHQTLDIRKITGNLFLAATTLYPQSTHLLRREGASNISNVLGLQLFMETHRYNTENALCIPKAGTVTKSTSIVTYKDSDIRYEFFPRQESR